MDEVKRHGVVGSVEYTNPCGMKVLNRRELEQVSAICFFNILIT